MANTYGNLTTRIPIQCLLMHMHVHENVSYTFRGYIDKKKSIVVLYRILYFINMLEEKVPKSSLTILMKFCNQRQRWENIKIFEGHMLIRILSITVLEIFCKTILKYKDIVKGITNPEEGFLRNH